MGEGWGRHSGSSVSAGFTQLCGSGTVCQSLGGGACGCRGPTLGPEQPQVSLSASGSGATPPADTQGGPRGFLSLPVSCASFLTVTVSLSSFLSPVPNASPCVGSRGETNELEFYGYLFFFNFLKKFIYFCLCWISAAVQAPSSCSKPLLLGHLSGVASLSLFLDVFICLAVLALSFYFPFIFIRWRLITLQYCSGFCHTLT